MNYKQLLKCLLTITILLCALTNLQAQDKNETELNPPGENVVFQWNRVLQDTIRTPGQQPPTIFAHRSFAMMHGAMFDAVNSIDGSYTPYLTNVPGMRNASIEAAAAQAAHDVLVGLYPTREAIYDAELSASLFGIPSNRVRQGVRVGQIVAAAMLAARANDGWNAPLPSYVLPPTPGNWQPVAPATAAGFTQYPGVTPFAIISNTQFAPAAPPTLTSDIYTRDFNEVKEIGSVTSATRTADQTQIARLWAGVNTTTTIFFTWNNVARTVAIARGTSTAENARLFALLNMAYHDALLLTMTSKFNYGLWRPTTAIRRADEDNNPNTMQDAAWTSLITNPPYPTYAGNHAAIGASQAPILAAVFGRDDIPFQHTWDGAGGATRSYTGFTAMANEESESRIYGGIHFRFDQDAGQSAGRNVASFLLQNVMKPHCNN